MLTVCISAQLLGSVREEAGEWAEDLLNVAHKDAILLLTLPTLQKGQIQRAGRASNCQPILPWWVDAVCQPVRVLNCFYCLYLSPWQLLNLVTLLGASLCSGQHWVNQVREGHFAKVGVGWTDPNSHCGKG